MVKDEGLHTQSDDSANSSDYTPVCVFFEDETINEVFSDLLQARGVTTRVLSSIAEAGKDTKIITEPRFFPMLDSTCHGKCLIVGNKDALHGLSVLSLSRPLTEEKIEAALSRFLRL